MMIDFLEHYASYSMVKAISVERRRRASEKFPTIKRGKYLAHEDNIEDQCHSA